MSKFLRVKCPCGNEQVIFASASSGVNCLVCSALLAEPSGAQVVLADGVKVLKQH